MHHENGCTRNIKPLHIRTRIGPATPQHMTLMTRQPLAKMPKTESALLGLMASIRRTQTWPTQLLAMLLSLTAHLILFLSVDGQITIAPKTEAGETAPDSTMRIHLVVSESSNSTQNTQSTSHNSDAPKIAEPRTFPPSQPTLQSTFPRFNFEILVPATPHYFSSSELTVKPLVSADIPENLGDSLSSDGHGAATFRLQINEQGEVDQVIVDESNFSEEDQRMVVSAFQKMKFEPGEIDGKAVKSELKIEVRSEKNGP